MISLTDESFIFDFVTESREHLNAIEPDLLAMEHEGHACSQEVINSVFRAIHSIKGGAGFFAFEALKTLTHAMESVLMQVRDKTLAVSPALMDPLFAGLDSLRAMLEDIQASDQVPIAKPMALLKTILDGAGVAGGKVEAHIKVGRRFTLNSDTVRSVLKRGMLLYYAKAYLHRDVDAQWTSPLAFLAQALSLGQCLEAFMDISDIGGLDDERETDLCVTLLFATVLEPDLLPDALKLPGSQIEALDTVAIRKSLAGPRPNVKAEPAQPDAVTGPGPGSPACERSWGSSRGDAEQASRAGGPPSSRSDLPAMSAQPPPLEEGGSPDPSASRVAKDAASDTLRVRVELLTKLMNLAGELVLGRNQLLRTMGPHAQDYPGLADILQNINQVTTELQEAAMQTRMQPVGTIFSRFPRIVRDLSRQMGKQIEVEVHGGDVELDKNIIELLADPLTHIIRNSVDHGLELPEAREHSRKKAAGRILLNAYHEGGQVNIVVEDDGKGIDPGNVARKAVEKGLITAAQGENLTDQEKINLVFAPGFSTAEIVSELSGRGVGMDVVRTNVEKLGGTVDLVSEPGVGTTVRLRMPLTLAIMPSMIVGVQGQRFAIPQVDVVELVWVRAEDVRHRVERVQGAEVLRLRDKLLPLVRLAEVLEIPRTIEVPDQEEPIGDRRTALADRRTPARAVSTGMGPARGEPAERRQSWRSDYHVVVLQMGTNSFGIIVDELHDFEEIVVKPLAYFLDGLACFSGTTILGDGRVILILDSVGLAGQARLCFANLQAEEKKRQEEEQRRLALQAARRRSVILFESGGSERFAVPQGKVLRLEQIQASWIKRMGETEYVEYRGDSLPVIRLDKLMPVSPLADGAEELYLVIPYVPGSSCNLGGILISNIIDALDLEVELKPAGIRGPGLLGTAVFQGHMTLFMDPVEVVQMATGGAA
jgi:two-component system chemotaxis sensor kinase CheA